MDCKDFEKLIPKFLKKECTPKEAEILLEHVRKCPDCKEEVTIQLLVGEGLNHLESGESFDLNAELEKLLAGDMSKKKRRRLLSQEQWIFIVDIIGGAVILGVIIALLVWNIQ